MADRLVGRIQAGAHHAKAKDRHKSAGHLLFSPGGISDSSSTVQPCCSMTAAMAGSHASLCSSARAAEGGGAPVGAKGLGANTLKEAK